MQKVIRATERAKTQAQRKKLILRAKNDAKAHKQKMRGERITAKENHSMIQAARIARREDWLLGPLAPRRDLGSSKETYGTVSPAYVQQASKPRVAHDHCIVPGDRVVVVGEFPEKGRIGTVKELKAHAACVIEGFNMVEVAAPKYMLVESESQDPLRTVEAPIPLSAVRLVYPLRHQETGILQDVVIKELKRTSASQRRKGLDGRYIADTDPPISIPWPTREGKEEELPEHDIDTLRIEVEEKTWLPTLETPPMPPSVIDELRNKYSIFRDRHDESWVRAREERAAERERAASVREVMMLTPLEELRRLKKLEKSNMIEKPLNHKILMRIGELMAQNKAPLARVSEGPRMARDGKGRSFAM